MRVTLTSPVLVLALWALCQQAPAQSQKRPNSPVFKDYRPPAPASLVEQSDVTYHMWQTFLLTQRANAGDGVAQHELALRYLTGRGVKADTALGAHWAARAAANGVISARFNLGILQYHGWGIAWNPFDAYLGFRYAAEHGMMEAQYVLGQFYADDLVVPRDWNKAYGWVKAAADSGFKPARDMLADLAERAHAATAEHTNAAQGDSSAADRSAVKDPSKSSGGTIGLIYLEFARDTASEADDMALLQEALREGNIEMKHAPGISEGFASGPLVDSLTLVSLKYTAAAGNPEALLILGRCYEKGIGVRRDTLTASLYYLRAIRVESPRAGIMLWKLMQAKNYFGLLKNSVDAGSPDAGYVWSVLVALGFDRQLTDDQALHLLERAAERGHAQAILELGLCYYSGRWVKQDRAKGIQMWRQLARAGNQEAVIRVAVAAVKGTQPRGVDSTTIAELHEGLDKGSILAQVALAVCYESGNGVSMNKGRAAKLYRAAAARGSRDAFEELKRMHNSIRPPGREYHTLD